MLSRRRLPPGAEGPSPAVATVTREGKELSATADRAKARIPDPCLEWNRSSRLLSLIGKQPRRLAVPEIAKPESARVVQPARKDTPKLPSPPLVFIKGRLRRPAARVLASLRAAPHLPLISWLDDRPGAAIQQRSPGNSYDLAAGPAALATLNRDNAQVRRVPRKARASLADPLGRPPSRGSPPRRAGKVQPRA
jgi:hypothetical protein